MSIDEQPDDGKPAEIKLTQSDSQKQDHPAEQPNEPPATTPWVFDPNASGVAFHMAQWVGPLPPPSILVKYNEAVPNAAERILKMAERQAAHRIDSERFVIRTNVWRSWGGLIAGFVISLVILTCGSLLIAHDHDWGGTTIITGIIVALATVFVYGQKSGRRELKSKEESVKGA
jgi:uncharacterized membrane protein